ncbi:hypothetical protein SLS60_006689 [Paraconiothyrium brasiliense]|uniref:beta-glucosidase n=1 Tax=Paraconiothyrium brasiliense TaxID=300254 RepID=A0ABR3RBI2_9PLEO
MTQSSTHFASLLHELTLEEKVALLSGRDFSTAAGVARLGIPPLRVADSVCGIRPSGLDANITTASFPNTACYGSTWDSELLGRLGEELARQARLKSAQVVLGPTINIHRDPRAGRNFECFSEDPLISGVLASAIVNGIQRGGVGACPKHFVANDAETLRHFYDVKEKVNGRPLREIYLAAWQHLLRNSDPEGVMTAYNKVDGTFCSEHAELYQEVLRGDWGYKGITMSDWFAVHDTVAPIKAGLDLEMPFPVFRGGRLIAKVKAGEVSEAEIDARALKMLELRDHTRACHSEEPERSVITKETGDLAREIARSGMVLLKNKESTLPIANSATLALIGEFAKSPVCTGGGSASCIPQYRHSPLDVLSKEFKSVEYAQGVRTRRIVPTVRKDRIRAKNGSPGVDIAFYNNDNLEEVVFSESSEEGRVWMLGKFKPGLKIPGSHVRLSTTLIPSTTGLHTLAVRCTGSFTLTVDGKEVSSGPAIPISTEQFIFNHILLEVRTVVQMQAQTEYKVELIMQGPEKLSIGEPTPYAAALCFEEAYSEDDAIEEAVSIARNSDVSIIYAGRNEEYESEGFDLQTIELPANQTRLIRAVAAASRKTVLVLHAGNPIDVSEVIDEVDAVLLAHFPGQEGALAAADLLTGRFCPSGKLATTWFKTLSDAPSAAHFPPKRQEDGSVTVEYAEGVGVGYRAAGCKDAVRWPFGYGLTYTSFVYRGLEVSIDGLAQDSKLTCSVLVRNSGNVEARDVVQIYITPISSTDVWRPTRELKGFTKTKALASGEEVIVAVEIQLDMACSFWDEVGRAWKVEPGTYGVIVGDQRTSFEVAEERVWNHL